MDSGQSKKRVKTSFVVDADILAEFKAEIARERKDLSEKIELLMEAYLNNRYTRSKPIEPRYTPDELHHLLDEVLAEGSVHLDAISHNLELLAFTLRIVGNHSIEDVRALRRRLSKETSKPEEEK